MRHAADMIYPDPKAQRHHEATRRLEAQFHRCTREHRPSLDHRQLRELRATVTPSCTT